MTAPGLVLTVATDWELPRRWLEERGVPVRSAEALRSGAAVPDGGALAVITGIGPAASREAVLAIRDRIAPRFVVNVGTAGSFDPGVPLGAWTSPSAVRDEGGRRLEIDPRWPAPWPETVERRTGGVLLTVSAPALEPPAGLDPDVTLVDMEAFAQADVLRATGTSFHVLKGTSDRPGEDVAGQFQARLPGLRRDLERILGFVEGPGPAAIGVVVPVRDRANLVGRALRSVLDQTLAPEQVVVVDDASTDGTREALARFGDRIRVLALREHVGVAAARNRGVEQLTTPWVAFLDSDDEWQPDKLAAQHDYLRAHPHYQALQCEEVWIRDGVRVNPKKHHAKPEGWIFEPSLERCLVSPSAVLLRTDLLASAGGFDETLPVCEDYDLWLRLSRWHPFGLDPGAHVVKYGGHDDQLSRRYPAMDRYRCRALMRALEREEHPRFRERIEAVLERKLRIVVQGARKRGRGADVVQLEDALQRLRERARSSER